MKKRTAFRFVLFPAIIITLITFFVFSLPDKNERWTDAGVVIYRMGRFGQGWMKNTNDFKVRVKQVWVSSGESTIRFRTLEPGQVVSQDINHQYGFYVLRFDGVEIGFIRLACQ